MKKRSKRIIFYLVLIVLILIASVLAINFINKNSIENNKSQNNSSDNTPAIKHTKEEIYEYGKKIEEADIPPNTVVAKINGEDILKCDVTMEKFMMENSSEDNKLNLNENAFYELLEKKTLEKEDGTGNYAKEIDPETIQYALEMNTEKGISALLEIYDISEDEKWLSNDEYINMYAKSLLTYQGALEGTADLVIEAIYNERKFKDEEYVALQEQYLKNIESNSETSDQLAELMIAFKKVLLLNQDIEFCMEENILSTEKPKDYISEYKNDNNNKETNNNEDDDENKDKTEENKNEN